MIESLGGGLGIVGLAGIFASMSRSALHAAGLGNYRRACVAPKAKHVIMLYMNGGPSQLDMFDPKPALFKYAGQRPSAVDLRTERTTGGLLPSPFEFKRYGRNGVEVSELLPQLASVIDEVCVIRSMYTFNPTHTPGRALFHTGSVLATRPSMGSWITYGLGTENENLPAFVALGNAAAADRRHDPDSSRPNIKAWASPWPIRIRKRSSRICATRTSTRQLSEPTWTRCWR